MYTVGLWLIYAGVVLRVFFQYAGLPQRALVMLLFALYGLLLLAEPLLRSWVFQKPGDRRKRPGEPATNRRWLASTSSLVPRCGVSISSPSPMPPARRSCGPPAPVTSAILSRGSLRLRKL